MNLCRSASNNGNKYSIIKFSLLTKFKLIKKLVKNPSINQ